MYEGTEQIDGIWYEYDNDIAIVSQNIDEDLKDKYIKIPEKIKDSDGYSHRVTKIENGAFFGCEKLEAIEISDSVEEIENNAFSGCVNLKLVKLPNKLTKIERCLFFECTNLQTLVIPDSVKSIGDDAFWCCENLTDLILPESLEKLGENVFGFCEKLTSLFIPASVTEINSKALTHRSSFESLEVDGENVNYFSDGNCVIEKSTNKLVAGCKNSVIPHYVTEIGDYAFSMISGLECVNLSQSVVRIGREAFSKCYSLQEVYIPSSVTQIGENAFEKCNFGKVTLNCDFARKPEGWADNLGVKRNCFVWKGKRGLFARLKSLFK